MVTQNKKWNVFSIIGLGMSVVGSIGFIGLIFSLIGFNQIKKTGEKGKEFAIAGIIVSTISIIFTIGYLLFSFVSFAGEIYSRFDDINWSNESEVKALFGESGNKPYFEETCDNFNGEVCETGFTCEGTSKFLKSDELCCFGSCNSVE